MELLMKNTDEQCTVSPNTIREALNTMQLAAVTTKTGERYIKARPHPLGPKIFRRLNLEIPDNINSKDGLIDLYKLNDKEFASQLSFL